MGNQRDEFEEIIREKLYREADEIEERVQRSEIQELSEEQKEKMRQKLKTRIDIYEKERAYAGLSEEDKKALALGRKMREENAAGKARRGRRNWKWIGSAAAVVALLCIYGTTSKGTGEKFASSMEQMVGERKILKINSDEGNKVLESEEEEKAYQKIKDAFGIELAILLKTKDIDYVSYKFDEQLQVAQMLYQYKNENLWYVISAGYYGSSFGFDADDEIIEEKDIKIDETVAKLTVYRRRGSGQIKCTVQFTYKKLEYFLAGNISKEDFIIILKNLFFS